MRFTRCFSALLLLALFACSGEPDLDSEPAPVPEEPDEAAIRAAMEEVELGSGVDEAEMEASTPGAFAMLTQGVPPAEEAEAATPKPKAVQRASTDLGLGAPGGQTLSGEEVQSGIRPNLPQVRACYEKELKKGGDFGGKVIVAWTIGADGAVRTPHVIRNSTGNRAMLPCITRVVSRWRFPKAESPTDIEYPFRFKPSVGF